MSLAVLRSLIAWVLLTHRPGPRARAPRRSEDLPPYRAYVEGICRGHGLPLRCCRRCGLPFVPYGPKRNQQRYCSRTCAYTAHLERNRIRRRRERKTPEGKAKKRRENEAYRTRVALGHRKPQRRPRKPAPTPRALMLQRVEEIVTSLRRFGPAPGPDEIRRVFDESLRR